MAKKKHPGAGRQKEQKKRAAQADQAAAATLPADLALIFGAAVFTTDVALPHLLHAVAARAPLPRARVRTLDVSAARAVRGVRTVKVLREAGTETSSFGEAWALVVAESRAAAEDARGLLKVDLEALPAAEPAVSATPPADEAFGPAGSEGAPDEVFQGAAFRLTGRYGWERQTLAEWEPHAIVCEPADGGLHVWAASEDPAGLASGLALALSLPQGKVKVIAAHVGAILGGRRGATALDVECARLALELKAPVRLVYDRTSELYVGGHRDPGYAEIELGADKDFHVTAWRSRAWPAVVGLPLPHLFIPAHRVLRSAQPPKAEGVATGEEAKPGASAPASPPPAAVQQLGAAFSGCAFDDLAALTGQSPLDLLLLNLTLAEPYGDRLQALLKETDKFVKWTSRWHPRGDASEGPVRRGLGLGFALWKPEQRGPAAPPPSPTPPAPEPPALPEPAAAPPPPTELEGPPTPSINTELTAVVDPATSTAPPPVSAPPAPGPVKDVAPGVLAIVAIAAAVDRQTGIVTVEKVSVVSERPTGTAAPQQRLIEAALARGATQGVSQALFEEGDAGRIAGACELGESAVQLIDSGLGGGDGSFEGWELAARWAAPAAAANAVTNAVALRLPTFPITAEHLVVALTPPPPPAPSPPPAAPAPTAPPGTPVAPGTTPPPADGTAPAATPPPAGQTAPPASTDPTAPPAPSAPTPPPAATEPPATPPPSVPPPVPPPIPPPRGRR